MSDADQDERVEDTETWPEMAVNLYDRLTGRNAVIEYDFDDMEIQVPSRAGRDAEHAHWHIDGRLTITTREREE